MKSEKTLSLLGLAARGGNVVSGEFSVEKAVRSGNAFLVLLAEDASENTKKKFRNMAAFHKVPLMELAQKESLGKAIGKENRSCAAVLDYGLANALKNT